MNHAKQLLTAIALSLLLCSVAAGQRCSDGQQLYSNWQTARTIAINAHAEAAERQEHLNAALWGAWEAQDNLVYHLQGCDAPNDPGACDECDRLWAILALWREYSEHCQEQLDKAERLVSQAESTDRACRAAWNVHRVTCSYCE